ncbi:MAG: zinc-ribbon domain-containing protein [Oscillospiraceae bacterium]
MFCRKCGKTIDDESTFCRFCGTEVVQAAKETRIEREYRQNNELYENAKELMDSGSFEEARRILLDLSGFRNADELAERCITGAIDYRRKTTYEHAKSVLKNDEATISDLLQAAEDLEALGEYEDAEELAKQCRSKSQEVLEIAYRNACGLISAARTASEMLSACESLEKLGSYKDSAELAKKGRSLLEKYEHYEYAVKCFNEANSVQQYMEVIEAFRAMGDFLDSEKLFNSACETIYEQADCDAASNELHKLSRAASDFKSIDFYKDAAQRAKECVKKTDELAAQISEQNRRKEEEAAKSELIYCRNILSNPKVRVAEIEEVEGRLYLIRKHEGAEAAIEECKRLRKKIKRNTVIGITSAVVVTVLIILSLIIVNETVSANLYSNAMSLAEHGDYWEAANAFSILGDYKDSREMTAKMRAQDYINSGKYRDAANELYNAGLYDQARECMITGFDSLLEQKKIDEAETLLNREIYYYSQAADCYYRLANAYAAEKFWCKAAEAYQGAGDYLDAEEKEKECYVKYADGLRNFGRYDDAIVYYEKGGDYEKAEKCRQAKR